MFEIVFEIKYEKDKGIKNFASFEKIYYEISAHVGNKFCAGKNEGFPSRRPKAVDVKVLNF